MPVDYLTRLTTWIRDTLWPARCAACGRIGVPACRACLDRLLPLSPLRCPGCQRHSRSGTPCPGCRGRVSVDRLVAATPLSDTGEQFIYALKYRGVRESAVPLAARLCDLLHARADTASLFASNPVIVPVPLHPSRLRSRGYNQAELLARRIAATAALPIETNALIRSRPTGQQVRTVNKAERRENMQGAFTVADGAAVSGRDIILIDDVVTTGATLEDCARALKAAGARHVVALTLAHG